MDQSTPRHQYSKQDVGGILGFSLFFLGLLGLLAPNTSLAFIDFLPAWLFGLAGYYVFWPLTILFGGYLFALKYLKEFHLKARYHIAAWLLFLGICSIFASKRYAVYPETSLFDYGFFHRALIGAMRKRGAGFLSDVRLGGGLLGNLLGGLFTLPKVPALAYFFGAILILGGLALIFLPLVFRKAGVGEKKKELVYPDVDRDGFYYGEVGTSDAPNPAPSASPSPEPASSPDALAYQQPSSSFSENAPANENRPLLTRTEYRAQQEASEAPSAPSSYQRPSTPAPHPAEPPRYSGVQLATFNLGADEEEPSSAPREEAPEKEEEKTASPSWNAPEEASERKEPKPISQSAVFEEEREEPAPEEPQEIHQVRQESPAEESAPSLERKEEPVHPSPASAERISPVEVEAPAEAPVPEKKEESANFHYPSEDELYVKIGEPGHEIRLKKAHKLPKYKLPGDFLLNDPVPDENAAENESVARERSALIDQCFQDYGVGAHVRDFTVGPTVTRYNIVMDPSVSAKRVEAIAPDVFRRMNGALGLYQDIVVGSDCVAFEIPNTKQAMVSFKETFDGLPAKGKTIIPFGKAIEGNIGCADLTKFPHMLVAGSSGSGKSVYINSLIISLMMRNRPEELKFLLIDPKAVEFSCYAGDPHLICPVVTEPTHAKVAMDKLCDLMDERYAVLSATGVRDIATFNREKAPALGVEPMPYIVVIVDEFSDLVMNAKDINEPVTRIGQKARAAGIHMVIATQRPEVKVISGNIKANVPVRVALRLDNAQSSSTILDKSGAETLCGHGDMLVKCEEISRMGFGRFQGCFISEKEINAVVQYQKEQMEPNYDTRFLDLEDHSSDIEAVNVPSASEIRAASDEEKYQMIKDTIMTRQFASISMIQREFSVGFSRAGKLFKRLQEEGIVAASAEPGAKGCKVLVHLNQEEPTNSGSTTSSYVTPAGFHTKGDE